MSGQIVSINVGEPITILYGGREVTTGIYKSPVNEPLYLTELNFAGDAQADLVYHGGKEKAVCVYSHEHYPYWERELNRTLNKGAFGENLTVTGMLESEVCIGDIYRVGEAVVQVSQPRQPCHKLAKRYDISELPLWVQNTGYTGFYFRVLEEGWVTPEDGLTLEQRHPMEVTVAFANQVMHHDKQNTEGINRLLDVKELSTSWRATLEKRLRGQATDTKKRLEG
ncbi:MOSC domain-containing protein [Brevibacillus humidisoli]|uniref:MOSC domain-containing protein n=1 Tax=Brevibacillus humidisoli TaxID=2895522 RepID=UPI001E2E3EBB|nr:MOSC domain-containing protein [Brevibacillus humidisoli]UFJ41447.1 MOSC domain-containing protein [Brevibacillus humidisoli]